MCAWGQWRYLLDLLWKLEHSQFISTTAGCFQKTNEKESKESLQYSIRPSRKTCLCDCSPRNMQGRAWFYNIPNFSTKIHWFLRRKLKILHVYFTRTLCCCWKCYELMYVCKAVIIIKASSPCGVFTTTEEIKALTLTIPSSRAIHLAGYYYLMGISRTGTLVNLDWPTAHVPTNNNYII